jgi:hypothetical protein
VVPDEALEILFTMLSEVVRVVPEHATETLVVRLEVRTSRVDAWACPTSGANAHSIVPASTGATKLIRTFFFTVTYLLREAVFRDPPHFASTGCRRRLVLNRRHAPKGFDQEFRRASKEFFDNGPKILERYDLIRYD